MFWFQIDYVMQKSSIRPLGNLASTPHAQPPLLLRYAPRDTYGGFITSAGTNGFRCTYDPSITTVSDVPFSLQRVHYVLCTKPCKRWDWFLVSSSWNSVLQLERKGPNVCLIFPQSPKYLHEASRSLWNSSGKTSNETSTVPQEGSAAAIVTGVRFSAAFPSQLTRQFKITPVFDRMPCGIEIKHKYFLKWSHAPSE